MLWHCRYGYTDSRNDEESFEQILMHRLKEFMKDEFYIQLSNTQLTQNPQSTIEWSGELVSDNVHQNDDEAETIMSRANQEALDRELGAIDKAWNEGVVHLMGETELVSHKGASICNKFVIVAFNFLKKNLRQADKVFHIPRKHLLKVGMIYEL